MQTPASLLLPSTSLQPFPATSSAPHFTLCRKSSSLSLRLRAFRPLGLEQKVEEAAAREETEFSGGGSKNGGSLWNGVWGENERMSEFYRKMLSLDPQNVLLLVNFGTFLHQVEGDVKGAEECYERAILASPDDGGVLSLYGSLVWERERDVDKAEMYLERAVQASPGNSHIAAAYARFLWEAEDEEADDEEHEIVSSETPSLPPFVQAF